MQSSIRFIQSRNADGAIFHEKVTCNVGLTDHELHCLKRILKQWRDAYGFPDESEVPAHLQRVTMASTARRIERELDRAMDRPETHFE